MNRTQNIRPALTSILVGFTLLSSGCKENPQKVDDRSPFEPTTQSIPEEIPANYLPEIRPQVLESSKSPTYNSYKELLEKDNAIFNLKRSVLGLEHTNKVLSMSNCYLRTEVNALSNNFVNYTASNSISLAKKDSQIKELQSVVSSLSESITDGQLSEAKKLINEKERAKEAEIVRKFSAALDLPNMNYTFAEIGQDGNFTNISQLVYSGGLMQIGSKSNLYVLANTFSISSKGIPGGKNDFMLFSRKNAKLSPDETESFIGHYNELGQLVRFSEMTHQNDNIIAYTNKFGNVMVGGENMEKIKMKLKSLGEKK